MKKISISAVVYSQHRKKDGSYNVKIRVTFDRKSKYISTPLMATARQLTRGLNIKDPVLLDAAEKIVTQLRKIAMDLNFFALESMTIEQVVDFLMRGSSQNFYLDFPEFAAQVISTLGAGSKNYRSAMRSFNEFVGLEAYDISIITSSLMERYEQWLTDRHGKGARAVSLYTNAIAYIHQKARRQYNNEESGQLRITNPFSRYKAPKQKAGEHRNAAPAIIQLMLQYRQDLSGRERLGVDAFLLSFGLMGMNAPDMYEAKAAVGNVITYCRRKTRDRRTDKAMMRVRVEGCLADLMDDYSGSAGKQFNFSKHYASYEGFSRAANIGLHQFARRMGWRFPLTIYTARHTWATIARSSACGIDKSIVNDCICHVDTGMRVTDLYAEKDWKLVWSANAKVLSLFSWIVEENLVVSL